MRRAVSTENTIKVKGLLNSTLNFFAIGKYLTSM